VKAGIIAAGHGERLIRGGVVTPKPLVPVGGEPLIARAIRAAASVKASSVACIVNDLCPEIAHYLRSRSWPLPLELIVRTTPNSMESLFSLAPLLDGGPFLLLTVDAVFGFKALERFILRSRGLPPGAGALALTGWIDDEKPLWARTDGGDRVLALGEAAKGRYVTAGFYYFTPEIFQRIEAARRLSLRALREFLALLVDTGYLLYGFPVAKTFDVDHPEDIEKAEKALREMEENSG
jgi:NDP-sugar pyrophosphorylase family protein